MSQTTADDLLSNLGLTRVNAETTKSVEPAVSPAPRRRNLVVALLGLAVLGAGFKLIGDYAADRAIDSWAARQQAQFAVVSPEVAEILKQIQAEGDAERALETAQESTTDSVSLNK